MKTKLALAAAAMLLAVYAHAQVSSGPAAPGPNAASAYRSAFDGYRPYQEEPVASWR